VGPIALAVVALLASGAQAQSTGGSFGSSDWGGGSSGSDSWGSSSSDYGSGSGSSYDWSSSSSSSYDDDPYESSSSSYDYDYDYGSSGSTSGGTGGDWVVWLALLVGFSPAILVVAAHMVKAFGQRRARAAKVRVAVYSVAVGGDTRRSLQGALESLVASGVARRSRSIVVTTVAEMLRGEEKQWVYVGGREGGRHPVASAQQVFNELVGDLRSRFRHETVRSTGGRTTHREAGPRTARPEEGEGLCVVSVAVASRGPLPVPRDRRGAMIEALGELTQVRNGDLLAYEVVWSPSEEDDRMSSAELEPLYPELRRVDGAMVGRVRCGHCGATFARELGECPTCSAPIAA